MNIHELLRESLSAMDPFPRYLFLYYSFSDTLTGAKGK